MMRTKLVSFYRQQSDAILTDATHIVNRKTRQPTPPRPACDTCSPGMCESPTLPA
jgi:hypothetical protein